MNQKIKKPKVCLFTAFLLIAILFISACNVDEKLVSMKKNSSDTFSSIQDQITRLTVEEMKRNQITGMSLALVDANGIIMTVNLGYADLENKILVNSDTIFKVGSISKLFTATGIMQLGEEGKIDIDKPLKAYIPEFSIKTRFTDADPITIRSLMTHRSGLPGNYLPKVLNPKYPYFTAIVGDLKQEYAAYPPNHITAYSNIGSVLLGVVLERVSGRKFGDYMTDRVLKPLEMNRSFFELPEDMVPFLSKGYRNNKPAVDDICSNGIDPEGSLHSSVNEMSHFIQMVLRNGSFQGKEILKETTMNAMLTPHPHLPLDMEGTGIDTTGSIGLNWFLYDDPYCGRILMHPGGTRLFSSKMIILKDSGLGVIVMANSFNSDAVVSKIATETLVAALKAKNAQGGYSGITGYESGKIQLEPLEGYFASGMGWIKVEQDERHFQMKVQKYPNIVFKLIKSSDGWNSCDSFFWGLFPVGIPDLEKLQFGTAEISGEHVLLANNNGVLNVVGEKIDLTPITAVWSSRCGHYLETGNNGLPSLGHEMLIQLDHGMMVGYLINKEGDKSAPLILTPVSDTELLIRGLGRDTHEIIRVVKIDGEERFSYEGLMFSHST